MKTQSRMNLYARVSRIAAKTLTIIVLLLTIHSGSLNAQQTEGLSKASQSSAAAETPATELSTAQHALVKGSALETSQQWGEALHLYQQAIKRFPNHTELIQRRAVARIHFDLQRRYSDSSFVRNIQMSNGSTALNVYAEVLLKVQSYYVNQPRWAELASYGLTSLEIALMSPDFRKINLPNATDAQIRSTILATRERLSKVTVNNRHDAYVVASSTAQSLEKSLGLNAQATAYEFVCGAITALDPYSAFMSSSQFSETMSQIEGNFVGLGVELRTQPEHLEIVSVIPGGSAALGGIVQGDRIVAVDRQPVSEIGSERAADLMRGPEGSFIAMTIQRGQGLKTISLERRRVEIPSVDQVGIVDKQSGVGYIRLTNFQKTTARDFDAALWKLHRDGMRSLIVDLRGNPGGLLSASVEVADRFIRQGVIVSTRGRNPMEDYTHQAQAASTWRVPLVVLIDENSASASEILAAAISDHKRGTIVGTQSYGKGSVQGIFPLNVSGGGVRLTTAKFYSPLGNAISDVGVAAHVLVHKTAKYDAGVASSEDNGLRVGIQTARKSLAKASREQTNSIGKAMTTTPGQTFAGR